MELIVAFRNFANVRKYVYVVTDPYKATMFLSKFVLFST